MTLNEASLNKKYKIVDCTLPIPQKTRFFEMGLVPKTVVSVLKVAPLGDPLEIEVLNYRLCLRKSQAKHFVIVEAN